MRRLLKYYFKRRILNISIFTLILLAVTISVLLNYSFEYNGSIYYAPISMPAIFMVVLATIVPICEFSFKMNKTNIDSLYSMPIKRSKIHLSRYIIGISQIVIPFTISYGVLLVWIAVQANYYDYSYFIGFYFLLLLLGLIIYTIVIFVYTRANTIFDGIIFLLFYAVILEFVVSVVRNSVDAIHAWNYFMYSPFFTFCYIFNEKSLGNFIDSYTITNACISILAYFIISIVFAIIYFKDIYSEMPENISQKSTSWFGYKTIIPIAEVFLSIYTLANYSIVLYILVVVGSYFLYVIYQRNFKIRMNNFIIYIASLLLGTGIGLLYYFGAL